MAATHLVDRMCNFDCTTAFLFNNQLDLVYMYTMHVLMLTALFISSSSIIDG